MRKNKWRIFWFWVLLWSVAILVGCNQGSSTVPATSTATQPAPPLATIPPALRLSRADLKYLLVNQFGKIFFCDPDLYPVGREVSDADIAQRVSELEQTEAEAIRRRLSLPLVGNLSPAENRLVDAQHKLLNAIELEANGQGYSFRLQSGEADQSALAIEGLMAPTGAITILEQTQTIATCPICLVGTTLIDTPQGAIPVQDLEKGMVVWTASHSGRRQLGTILQTVRRAVPRDALIVYLVLEDGRELSISAGHPTADGRVIGELEVGDYLDSVHVVRLERIPLQDSATYDILVSGETGGYWANGIFVRSTLRQ